MDLIAKASQFATAQRHEHMSRTVTYERGADVVQIQATPGESEFDLEGRGGGLIRAESRDYLIRAEDLVLATGATLPEDGDVIREVQGARELVCEVSSPGPGEPVFKWSDPDRRTLRVHTKVIEE